MPVFGLLVYFLFNSSQITAPETKWLFIQTIVITVLMPMGSIYFLISLKKVDSLMIPNLNQRKIPLILQCFFLILFVIQTKIKGVYPELYFFFWGSILSISIAFLLTFFKIKASLHMIGITALTTFSIVLSFLSEINFYYAALFFILSNSLVALSRLIMKAHTVKELIIGGITGLIPQLIAAYFLL